MPMLTYAEMPQEPQVDAKAKLAQDPEPLCPFPLEKDTGPNMWKQSHTAMSPDTIVDLTWWAFGPVDTTVIQTMQY